MKKNSSLLKIIPTKLEASPVIHVASNGASEFMTNISSSLVSMLFNLQLLKYLKENGVAAYGVLMYAQFIFVAIYFGYTVGISPVISYHYGAENDKEVKNLFQKSYTLIGISPILITVICRFSSPYLAQLFVGYSKNLLEITIKAFSLYCFTFLFFGLNTTKNVPRYPANLFAGGIGTIQFFRHTGSEYTALRFPYSCYLRSLRSNLTTIACYPRTDRF